MVVRDDVLAAHPGLAADALWAFTEARDVYLDRVRARPIAEPTATDIRYARVMELTRANPLPYGIAPNRRAIDELVGHALRQHILPRAPDVETLFAEGTRDLIG